MKEILSVRRQSEKVTFCTLQKTKPLEKIARGWRATTFKKLSVSWNKPTFLVYIQVVTILLKQGFLPITH